jgi:hypothetical protein
MNKRKEKHKLLAASQDQKKPYQILIMEGKRE